MKKIYSILIIAITLASGLVYADNTGKSYIGVGYAMGNYSEAGFPGYEPTNIKLNGGYYISDTFAIEGNMIIGGGYQTKDIGGIPFGLKVNSGYGVYARGEFPSSNKFRAYGLVGFYSGSMSATAGGTTFTLPNSGLSFGLGGEYRVGENIGVGLDWMNYDVPYATLSAITINTRFLF